MTQQLATVQTAEQQTHIAVGMGDVQSFDFTVRVARMLSQSTMVPKEYQGKIENCVIALNMANRINSDPLMVMQNLVVVHGKPTWSAQFLIATANACGRFSALRYEFVGQRNSDDWGCRAWAVELETGERLTGSTVTIGLSKKEGWYSKSGSKWQTMPEQMLMYRAGAWWVRSFAPELSMGLHTADEIRDTYDAERDVSGSYSVGPQSKPPAAEVAGDSKPPKPEAKTEKPRAKSLEEQAAEQAGKIPGIDP